MVTINNNLPHSLVHTMSNSSSTASSSSSTTSTSTISNEITLIYYKQNSSNFPIAPYTGKGEDRDYTFIKDSDQLALARSKSRMHCYIFKTRDENTKNLIDRMMTLNSRIASNSRSDQAADLSNTTSITSEIVITDEEQNAMFQFFGMSKATPRREYQPNDIPSYLAHPEFTPPEVIRQRIAISAKDDGLNLRSDEQDMTIYPFYITPKQHRFTENQTVINDLNCQYGGFFFKGSKSFIVNKVKQAWSELHKENAQIEEATTTVIKRVFPLSMLPFIELIVSYDVSYRSLLLSTSHSTK